MTDDETVGWHHRLDGREFEQAPGVGDGLQPARLLCPWDFPDKNTGEGCHFLLQGIFPTQGSNPRLLCLLQCRQILLLLSHRGFTCMCLEKSHNQRSLVGYSPWGPKESDTTEQLALSIHTCRYVFRSIITTISFFQSTKHQHFLLFHNKCLQTLHGKKKNHNLDQKLIDQS